jgi:hypothetical protein
MFGVQILLWLTAFCAFDTAFTAFKLEGVYYLIHSIHNGIMVYATAGEVYTTLTNFPIAALEPTNYFAAELCFGLHLYHIAYYWRKFRFDDWLHHILMIGIALPIGINLPAGTMLGFSLFFTTGLPGGIDYLMLFLNRNNLIRKETQKRINMFLATWVRSPGCAAQAALTCALLSFRPPHQRQNMPWLDVLAYLSAALNYWNGQYFASQVIYDAGVRRLWGGGDALPQTARASV